jgi:PAP2 superfamily
MNKLIFNGLAMLMVLAIFQSCEKDLPTNLEFSAYDYASLDEDGGTWRTMLLDSASQIALPVPADAGSASYQAEVADVKAAAASLNSEQLEAVKYWSNNGIVRWNEIARELAAKYNLVPAANADGTYTLPDPANPGNYPNFPFAHPPYTCRMLAYWSAAQYDALVATWHYKYRYNRPAPYKADASISTHLPQTDLPGYPSDGAAVAAVSKAILSAMFPLEKEYIAEKAAEHENSLIWAGVNVQSDIVAGDSLGRGVAAVFIARSKTDGMKTAQTPKAISDSLRTVAKDRWGWQWDNLEIPPRPVGITPYFGQVKPWCIPNVEAVRPVPPPAPGSVEFEAAVKELKDISDNLTNEQRKIANFWSDGAGTYTPPGHWNRFASGEIVKYQYNPLRSARTFAYMNMAIMDAGISCWDAKYYYHYPRPTQVIPGFKAILGVPNFPGYTSGHSTFSAAAATVLSHFFPADQAQFEAWAQEAADSRVYAGIHFRFDSEVGNSQGRACGNYAVEIAKTDGGE